MLYYKLTAQDIELIIHYLEDRLEDDDQIHLLETIHKKLSHLHKTLQCIDQDVCYIYGRERK